MPNEQRVDQTNPLDMKPSLVSRDENIQLIILNIFNIWNLSRKSISKHFIPSTQIYVCVCALKTQSLSHCPHSRPLIASTCYFIISSPYYFIISSPSPLFSISIFNQCRRRSGREYSQRSSNCQCRHHSRRPHSILQQKISAARLWFFLKVSNYSSALLRVDFPG